MKLFLVINRWNNIELITESRLDALGYKDGLNEENARKFDTTCDRRQASVVELGDRETEEIAHRWNEQN